MQNWPGPSRNRPSLEKQVSLPYCKIIVNVEFVCLWCFTCKSCFSIESLLFCMEKCIWPIAASVCSLPAAVGVVVLVAAAPVAAAAALSS